MTIFALLFACKTPDPSALEADFAVMGDSSVTTYERTLEDGTPAIVHAPTEGSGYPVLIWANGTASTPDDYEDLLTHLASWGFVVFGAYDEQMGTGERGWELVELARDEQELADLLDLERMGTLGTSQGAVSSINTYLLQDRDGTIDTIVANALPAPTWVSKEDAYDASDIHVPTFIASGTGDSIISPRKANFRTLEAIRAPAPSIAAHRRGVGHLQVEGDGGVYRGAITAWMLAQLHEDEAAAAFFDPAAGELFTSPAWKNVLIQPAEQ